MFEHSVEIFVQVYSSLDHELLPYLNFFSFFPSSFSTNGTKSVPPVIPYSNLAFAGLSILYNASCSSMTLLRSHSTATPLKENRFQVILSVILKYLGTICHDKSAGNFEPKRLQSSAFVSSFLRTSRLSHRTMLQQTLGLL